MSQYKKINVLVMLALIAGSLTGQACVGEIDAEPLPTDEPRAWTFTELPGDPTLRPCGPRDGFTGPLTELCAYVQLQTAHELECAGRYVFRASLAPQVEDDGSRVGDLRIVQYTCASTYRVVGR